MVTTDQARAAGLSQRQVDLMVERGEWRRPYRGVLVDNSVPITPLQAVVAASFATGGLASHRLCLWLWDLRPEPAADAIEFSVEYGKNARVPGVKIYRVKKMPPAFRKGIVPVTSPMRGLLDTAAVAPEVVQEAMIRAFVARLFTPKAVETEIVRAAAKGKPGVSALRTALKDLGAGRYPPSELERRAKRLFRARGLPPPQVEVVFGDDGEYRLDFYWPEADLVVEVDGWSIHATPLARRRDFQKQNRIVIGNHWILRYDWVDIVEDAARTAAEILEAYAARTRLVV
ncbi:MAG: hypothetical protein JO086_02855 [Acidimicrobiia bacterium]|nr:hypothetical protein [Acidimicrobiia bacterium]